MSHVLSSRSKNRLEFSIHSAALAAFSFFHSRQFWVDKAVMQQPSLDQINVGLTLQAVRISNNKIAIVSGFESFSFSLTTLKLVDCEVLIHDEMSDVQVEKRAWLAVLRTMLSSIDNKSAEDFRRALNQQAPKTIIKFLFDKNKLSQKQLSVMTHSSRSSLAQQNAKAQTLQTPSNKEPSIFEQLLRENKRDV
ncbi:hypothetical protein DA099_14750 [Photobacterium damselae]|uniref:hypothetical protein n=1 Tax=Photobacterium damselae TaxID=38293 RepID=UPI001110BDD7|nr:hypothetical protein [Photobacterium damselae]TMX46558.1 hypothetical protein DA099_14750 [Photobacterium damselae]TMX63165.1 hypothetical protein DA090_17340 [Photobacterium damselae]